MKTGEGKTLVATLPLYLNALEGHGAHLVTVNDYLAKRDAQWYGPDLRFARPQRRRASSTRPPSSTRAEKVSDVPNMEHLTPCPRREAYHADITYGTNNEFGFDYLRDNMAVDLDRTACSASCTTPSSTRWTTSSSTRRARRSSSAAPPRRAPQIYFTFARLVPRLHAKTSTSRSTRSTRAVILTEEGVEQAGAVARRQEHLRPGELPPHALHGGGAQGADPLQARPRLRGQGRRGHHRRRLHRPADVRPPLVRRPAPGRRGEGGREDPAGVDHLRHHHPPELLPPLRQAGRHDRYRLRPRARSSSRSTSLDVVVIPTHQPHDPREYSRPRLPQRGGASSGPSPRRSRSCTRQGGRCSSAPSPSRSRSTSPRCCKRKGIPHQVLNAKQHEKEAGIIAQAGRYGGVTIATNMAGRGTDIILGGKPDGRDPRGVAGGARQGRRGRRPPHHRHRAPRGPPHRQPAPRPRRPPGRPRQLALLRLLRGRHHAPLRPGVAAQA